MSSRFFIPLLVVVSGMLNGCVEDETELWEIKIRDTTLEVEIADTADERSLGLMYRDEVPYGTGMLFIFQETQMMNFWMKNTYVPLSVAYIDESGTILEIYDMEPESIAPVRSRRPALYALEVPMGFFTEMGISIGDRVRMDGLPTP